jgi:two-component system, cell cycle sensor histidine kinase and response regulator CckA
VTEKSTQPDDSETGPQPDSAALHLSERRFRALVENSADAIAVLGPDGTLIYDSPSAPGLLGYAPEDWVGQSILGLIHPDDLPGILQGLQELAHMPGDRTNRMFRLQHKSGRWLWIEATATNLLHEPSIAGIVVNYRDVTERVEAERQFREANRRLEETLDELRQTQAQLVRQERLAAVGQLAAGIAHDFNNILSVILLHLQLSLRHTRPATPLHSRLETIAYQAGRAADLVQQILDFSRSGVLQTRAVAVWPFLQEQVQLLRRTIPEHIHIRLSGLTHRAVIHADPTRMQQLLTNLALNARDAMPQGGELHIHLEQLNSEQVRQAQVSPPTQATGEMADCMTELQDGAWIRLTVRDTGSGIPARALPHIFEPFFTTKEPGAGTGLGLAQVYGIVKQHKGFIDVQSQEEKGTAFHIYLPATETAPTRAPAPLAQSPPLGQGETILVVEDNASLRAALVDTLKLLNYHPLTAHDGRDALAILAEPANKVALVLSDLTMPNMGGQTLFRELRNRGWHVPMVILSGHVVAHELDALTAEGLAGWLPKPPEIQQLADLFARILHGAMPSSAQADTPETQPETSDG